MKLEDTMAGSDEMFLRTMSAAFGCARDRGLDLNNPAHAAVIEVGVLRFIVALHKAYGSRGAQLPGLLEDMFAKDVSAIQKLDDPGVRHWFAYFMAMWGADATSSDGVRCMATSGLS